MKVYIASMFADKDRVLSRAKELAEVGIECTSRWASETVPHNVTMKDCPTEYMRETAVIDLDDIIKSDVVVLTVPEPELLVNATVSTASRGGRHFESGVVYGLMIARVGLGLPKEGGKELIILGRRENVFHCLDGESVAAKYPTIRTIETWEEVKQYLISKGRG